MIKPVRATGLERLELRQLRDRVGKLFAALQEAVEADEPLASGTWVPPVDLCETADAILLRVELPGVKPEEVNVGLTNTRLRVWGNKHRVEQGHRIVSHLCSERSYGSFSRVVPLRWTISVKYATANLKNGILLIRLPKIEERRGAEFKITVTEPEEGE